MRVLVELGADVNAGDDNNTPICLAVQSQNSEMVSLLLQHGVNNVHNALDIAREKKFDKIIGLLLEHINALDEKHSGVVSLSELKLQTVKPEWILPSLGVRHIPKGNRHRRNRSLGHMRELLQIRRKSVGCISDKSLESFRYGLSAMDKGGIDEPDGATPFMHIPRASSPQKQKQLMERRHSSFDIMPVMRAEQSTPEKVVPDLSSPSSSIDHEQPAAISPENHSGDDNHPESTPKKRRSGVNASPPYASSFEPHLSPIHGTPVLNRPVRNDREVEREQDIDSGVASVNINTEGMLTPPKPKENVSLDVSTPDVSLNSSRHTLRYRRLQEKGIVTGVRKLPFSSVNEYSQQRKLSAESLTACDASKVKSRVEFAISPTQLLHNLRKFRKSRKRRSSSYSSALPTRPDSPLAEIYPSKEYYDDIELQLFIGDVNIGSSMSESGGGSALSSSVFSPSASLIMKDSNSAHRSSSASSSILITPASSRKSSMDVSFSILNHHRPSRDEIDFPYEAIPEDSTVSPTNTELIKGLNLSSNELESLNELVFSHAGDLVIQHLKGLETLDLKQNKLSQLPLKLMQVSLCLKHLFALYSCSCKLSFNILFPSL